MSRTNSAQTAATAARAKTISTFQRRRMCPYRARRLEKSAAGVSDVSGPARVGKRERQEETTMNRLDGKVAFLSGAARGIGGATAKLMTEAGAKVVIGDVLDEVGTKHAKEIGATYLHLDVTQEASWAAAMDATVKAHGKLDVLVNNAGIFNGKGVEEASLDEWSKLVAVNLTGVVLGTRAALPHLKKSGNAAIVNLASIAGLVGSQLDPLYSLTKGGVTLFTKSTA